MKRLLLSFIPLLIALTLQAQLNEDFSNPGPNWVYLNGAQVASVNGNNAIVTPGVGGNNPAAIGTPKLDKTSNTFKVCFDIFAYSSNLKNILSFPCDTYVDFYFAKSHVSSNSDLSDPNNIYAAVTDQLLPTNGGSTCYSFPMPAGVPLADFRLFITFHAACNQGGIKYVLDNLTINGVVTTCECDCPPIATNDQFRRVIPNELSFSAVLYGSNIFFPPPPPGYAVDTAGTDYDQDDTYTHLRWAVVTQPANGSVVVNNDGTATINRNDPGVPILTFTYRLFDDGADNNFATTGDNLADTATVTVLYGAGAPLPVSMVNFSGNRAGSAVVLKWTTVSESNSAGFEIQRLTGNVYQRVGYIASKAVDGFSNNKLQYEFREEHNSNAIAWYRLVEISKDGQQKILPVTAVRGIEALKKMLIYPNPGPTVNILFGSASVRDISITDISGKLVKRWNSYADDNLTVFDLQTGIYMLVVTDRFTLKNEVKTIFIKK